MKFDIVCFDCDSTLSAVEGIDELARRVGLGEEMARLTNLAMNGEVPLQEVYAKRLQAIQPDNEALNWVADIYVQQVVAGAREVIQAIQNTGITVHIVSGGLRQAILPLAAHLGVAKEHVHAVDIFFNADGSYQGFDHNSPLAQTGGKATVCKQINPQQLRLVMVGDGQTDLEAKQAGAKVIGFGGVAARAAVKAQADYYIEEASLLPILPLIV